MATPRQPAGMPPRTFPRKEQPIALTASSADRFTQQKSHFRLALQAALAAPGGYTLRASPIISLFAASLIILAPTHALAQQQPDEQDRNVSVRDRARPEYDPLGLRFGGFDLHASLDLAATSTDNLFAEETDTDSDIILEASPRARLSSHWSRHALAIEAGGTLPSHQDFSSEDVNTGYLRGNGRLDIGSNTAISANAGVAHLMESRVDPDRPPQTQPPVEYDETDMGIGIEHTFNRFRVGAFAARNQYDYDGAQAVRSFDQDSFTGRIEAEISPRIGLLLEATTDQRDYDNAPGLSSDGQTYLVGASLRLTDLLRGRLAVGQFSRDYDNGISEDGLAVDANLEWYVTRLTTLTFTGRRNTEDTVGANTVEPYIQTEYGARVDHELLRNLILTGGFMVGKRDYDVSNLTDDYNRVELGADYLLNRRWALRGRYTRDSVSSDLPGRDFDVNRFTVGLTFRL